MDHSLINLNQIRAFCIDMPNDPIDKNRNLRISHDAGFISFESEGFCVYFEVYVPYDDRKMQPCTNPDI